MTNNFAYTDEADKCYGITGMVLSLDVWDKFPMLSRVSIDDDDEPISFTPDFFFYSNPRYSAKIAWNEMLQQYQVLTGLVAGNVLCRTMVHAHKTVTRDIVDSIRQLLCDDGHEVYSLDDDEIDTIINKTVRYLTNFYSDYQVGRIADRLSDLLQQRRSLTGSEVIEQLQLMRR